MKEDENDIEIDYADILKIIGENVNYVKESDGDSQNEMARKLRTHQACVSKVISGNRDLRLLNIYYLAAEYGINLNWLFGLSKEKYQRESRIIHQQNLEKKKKAPKRTQRVIKR